MHVSRARARVGAVASLGADAPKMPTDTIRGRLVECAAGEGAKPKRYLIGSSYALELEFPERLRSGQTQLEYNLLKYG